MQFELILNFSDDENSGKYLLSYCFSPTSTGLYGFVVADTTALSAHCPNFTCSRGYWPVVELPLVPAVVPPVLPAAPVVPLVLPAPVPVETGPLLMVPPLVVLPVVPEVELPPPAPPAAASLPLDMSAPSPVLIESIAVLEVPLMSELPLASESVATSPEPVLDSEALPLPPHELKERAALNRAAARKLKRGLYIKRKESGKM